MKRLVILSLTLIFAVSCNRSFTKILKSDDFNYKLEMADKYYQNKKYNKAQQLYTELFPIFKGTDKFEDLYYKYAFCAFYMKDYANAENLFNGYLGVFPNNPRAEEIAFMHAYTFYKQSPKVELDQSNTLKAIGMLQGFVNTHPNSKRVPEALDLIADCRAKLEEKEAKSAKLYYNLKQYQAAEVYYNNLVNEYPDSEKGDEYMYMALKASYEFANQSVKSKQQERYQVVVDEYFDFLDRFPDSKRLKDAESIKKHCDKLIKELKDERTNQTAGS